MKIIFLLILSLLFISCSFYRKEPVEGVHVVNNMNTEKNLIVPVQEMGTTPELEELKFIDTIDVSIKNKILELITVHKNELQQVNLEEISGWAKEQMKGYKIPDDFMNNLETEGYYKSENYYGLYLKSVSLPVHNPLVKRNLYLIPVYDPMTEKIVRIFLTIQGYVEE